MSDDIWSNFINDLDMESDDGEIYTCHNIHPELNRVLNQLEHPMENRLWQPRISALQDQLRSCLSEELIERVVNIEGNMPSLINADRMELKMLIIYAVTLAWIAKEHFDEIDGETPEMRGE
jgi:hypothetical protein